MTGLCLGGQPASHPKELCSRPWVHCSSVGNESLAASLTSVGARVWQGCPGQDWHGQATALTMVLRSIIHRPPASCLSSPGVGMAPAPPLLAPLPAPPASPTRVPHPPSCPARTLPAPSPPSPMAAPSGSWVTFSSWLLEALPCPLPPRLELEGSFICHCLF